MEACCGDVSIQTEKSINLEQTEIYRLPGLRKIKRNDVVVFNFPYPNDWNHIEMHIMKYYIKSCIGLPGDTASIRKGVFNVGCRHTIGECCLTEPHRIDAS